MIIIRNGLYFYFVITGLMLGLQDPGFMNWKDRIIIKGRVRSHYLQKWIPLPLTQCQKFNARKSLKTLFILYTATSFVPFGLYRVQIICRIYNSDYTEYRLFTGYIIRTIQSTHYLQDI